MSGLTARELVPHYAAVRRRLLCPPSVVKNVEKRKKPDPFFRIQEPVVFNLQALERRAKEITQRDCLIAVKLETVIHEVCQHFKITQDALVSPGRQLTLVRPRQIAFYLATRLTKRSLKQIGGRFNRDHTTVMHGVCMMKERLLKDEKIKTAVIQIEQKLIA